MAGFSAISFGGTPEVDHRGPATNLTRSLSGILIVLAVLGAACAKRTAKTPLTESSPASGRLPEPSIRGSDFMTSSDLKTVQFDFDRYHLDADAAVILKKNAQAIKNNPKWVVLVEGHCDERGTTPYNLSLGQRRAKAVRDYYLNLGIEGDRIATISYGEERPACPETSEDCWAKNRRAESKIKNGSPAGAADRLDR